MTDRLLTTREVASILAVSPETVLRRIRTGDLPAIRLASNALRIRESEVESFLERSAYKPAVRGCSGVRASPCSPGSSRPLTLT